MNPGNLRRRISLLQKQISGTDSDGYPIKTWEVIASVWAGVQSMSGREYFQAASVQAETNIRFTVRYRKDIKADMRIRYDGQDYEIKNPPMDVDGRRRWLQIMAEVILDG